MFVLLLCFMLFVLNVLQCIAVLYCIDVRLSHLNKYYLLTYLLTSCNKQVQYRDL